MSWLQPRLQLKVSQKQILTPGLVQMVSVLALNRLELREMINQEMVANPMLEELTEESANVEQDYSEEAFLKAETEKVPETEAANPFDEFDVSAFFNQYLDSGSGEGRGEHEVIEKPSFDKFISSPQGLSEHLQWQLSVTVCSEIVREIAEVIIGNLDENGYLTVSLEEIAKNGNYSADDVEEALAVVQEFDPLGVGARNLRECLLIQLRTLDAQNGLAQQIVSECMPKRPLAPTEEEQLSPETPLAKLLQANQLKEVARALNRPVELVKRAMDLIRTLDPRPGLRYNKTQVRLVEPDVYFRKMDDAWQVFMNEDDVPQLRLSPVYRRLLQRGKADSDADRDVRNYVKERFTAALQLMKSIEQRKHTILRVCQSIIARQADFLEHGADHLRPMMIKEVAEEVGVHPSTVSRAVSSKYAHTPQGVMELRSFFSESVNGPEGYGMSLQTLKRVVKKMIEEEDTAHPLTDDHIAKKLAEGGIQVTRRTVAKYREDLRIPSTHQRRVKA
jgi:RNA polymerase sigma-54 factor